MPRFSVIIPARNEERFLGACLDSIEVAAVPFPGQVGARTICEDARNLSAIRNAGAHCAIGEVFVTIDADSAMSPHTLAAIDGALTSGKTWEAGLGFDENLASGEDVDFAMRLKAYGGRAGRPFSTLLGAHNFLATSNGESPAEFGLPFFLGRVLVELEHLVS